MQIEKEHIRELFLFGCAGGSNVIEDYGAKAKECRIVGGFSQDLDNKHHHKDLDVLLIVEDADKLENKEFRAFNAKGLGEEIIKKPVDLFVCDDDKCLKPITTGRGIEHQKLVESDVNIQDEGILMEEYLDGTI